ncbi:MAG TPA: hypothetical protein VGD05_01100 [Pyrinomonadaceae bacterium]|jgi:hypothetical protein
MKKKFLVVLSALLVFGLAAAVFAYNRTNNTNQTAAASSCPMHKQMASTVEHNDSCCGMADCCKDGKCSMGGACCKDKDSCPMKQKGESKTTNGMDMSKVTVVGDSESCCQPGADCCKGGGTCCKHKS